jgi:heavy metal translocating P-type ATPase
MPPPSPYIFDEFFASGKEESISPFLTPSSRHFGKNLPLKIAGIAAFLLLCAFISSFLYTPLSSLFLIFVYFFAGTPALLGALEDLKNFEINIDVLMTFAALLSAVIGSEMEGALLLVLFELSGAMEEMVSQKTKGTVSQLHQLSPRFACMIDQEGTIFERAVKEIPLGAHLLIKAGEIIPLDGKVIQGSSFVNLVHLTGESHPIAKHIEDEVQAGSRNLDGALTIAVTRTSADSTLSRIIALITEAHEAKPKLQRYLDRFGKWYATLIMSLSLLFAIGLPFLFSLPFFGPEGGIYRALAFLIAASPCALIIATPTAYLSAISACARQGILLKGGVILDAIASCKIIAFDKTGTLTTGKLSCVALEQASRAPPPCSLDEALAIAYSLERNAVHPIAHAIADMAKEKQLKPIELLEFQAIAGSGLQGTILIKETPTPVFIGREEFILSMVSPELRAEWVDASPTRKKGYLSSLLLIKETLFLFQFLDTVRPDSALVIARLKYDEQLHPMMLTGDHHDIAQLVAQQVGIEEVHANLRPEDKLAKIAALSQEKGIMMIGDGINDAPALARSTVGISMGKIGSATAIDASDVVFLNDDLSLLSWLNQKAKDTLSIVKQNIFLALGVIVFATTPALLGFIPLWLAVILHEGGTVLVGLNSLRLLRGRNIPK